SALQVASWRVSAHRTFARAARWRASPPRSPSSKRDACRSTLADDARAMPCYRPRRERAMTNADPPPPVVPAPVFDSAFSRWVTLVLGVAVVLLLVFALVPGTSKERVENLKRPAAYVVRVFERDLEAADVAETEPAWIRMACGFVLERPSSQLAAAIA